MKFKKEIHASHDVVPILGDVEFEISDVMLDKIKQCQTFAPEVGLSEARFLMACDWPESENDADELAKFECSELVLNFLSGGKLFDIHVEALDKYSDANVKSESIPASELGL